MKALFISVLVSGAFCSLLFAAEKEARKPLPAPVSEKTYTFQQIEEQKVELKNKVVRVELARLLGEGVPKGDGLIHYIAKDTSKSATPYGQIAFAKEDLEKSGLAGSTKGPVTVYVRVHVFEEQKSAAALCIAVGTRVALAEGKAVYSW
ncbi:MAG TPA: hypothetical protein VM940_05780 [Chthoniobacterales bacterium]|jgi:hypothetical protein|nr:hypothetical protein [Chthoniobacterales bacterium]